jgi:predicted glycoside hydrolase/deacetylase ChbG (UPF0249 family)
MATKKLLIIADDYGAHNIIDNGIHECIDKGVIDGTDAFVTHETSKKRLEDLLEKYKSKIASGDFIVGLHLNLNVGGPIIQVNPYPEIDIKYAHFNSYLLLISDLTEIEDGKLFRKFKYAKAKDLVKNLLTLENEYIEFLEAEMIAQFNKFKDIVGHYPEHVSSHNGIFQATEKIYRFMSKFCNENQIHMRCPTLLTFDPDKGDLWKVNPEQDLYPEWGMNIAATAHLNDQLRVAAKMVINWTKNNLKKVHEQDRKDGLFSTDYCIEHFFKNGTIQKLRKILDKIHVDPKANSYELIVHPVTYNLNEDFADIRRSIPFGIENGSELIKKRLKETKTLIAAKKENVMKDYEIQRFKIPSNGG